MVHTSQCGYLQTGTGWEGDDDTSLSGPGPLFSNTAQTGLGICGAMWEGTCDASDFRALQGPLGETSQTGLFWCGEAHEASGGQFGYIGIVRCSGKITAVTIHVNAIAAGITNAQGRLASTLGVLSKGQTLSFGSIIPSVRLLGASGIAQCSGSIISKVTGTARGLVTCQGGATPVVAITASCVGRAQAQGYTHSSIIVRAVGRVTCIDVITPSLLGSSDVCGQGPAGAATINKNRAY